MSLLSTEKQFSKTFAKLLRHLALSVSETDRLLFFVFQMVESMFFERASFNRIKNDLLQFGRCMFHSQQQFQSLRFRYTISLDKSNNVNNDNIPLYKFCYKLTRARERDNKVIDKEEAEKNYLFQRCFFHNVDPESVVRSAPSEPAGPFTFAHLNKHRNVTISESEDTDVEINNNNEIADLLSSSSSSSSDNDEDEILEENVRGKATGKKYPLKLTSLPAPATLALCAFRYW